MAIHQYKVYHFHEFVQVIEDIGKSRSIQPNEPPVLWSRGHSMQDWNLRPTLIRNVDLRPLKNVKNATGRALEEELRKEHYIAKNYHFLAKEPRTNIEWMEVMQHHGVKTRMLDWSESVMHSLIFSLEVFFDDQNYRSDDRIGCAPCIWLLEPIEWNMMALRLILMNDKILDSCLDTLSPCFFRKGKIKSRMRQIGNELDNYMKLDSAGHLKGIFNLSSIWSEMNSMHTIDLKYLLEKGELYYCLCYILIHIYLSTELRGIDQVLPLAIVESYHSERIRAQKGAFTLFPYYEESPQFVSAKKLNIQLDAMEYMHLGNHFLHKIQLCNPDEIAYEVMSTGMNVSWLYPEMPVVANAIETRKIFT